MALTVHCSYEPGWYPHGDFREIGGDLVHWVEPPHLAANGQPLNVEVHGTDHLAAIDAAPLGEVDVRRLTGAWRDEP